MPKIIAHALTGAAIIAAVHPKINFTNLTPFFIGMFIAVSPDLDIIIEWLFGIPDFHRGLTHSLIFSFFIWIAIYYLIYPGQERAAFAFSLCYLSHPILDLATSTSGGIKLLYPFSDKFYHLGLTNIFELPFGANLSEILLWCRIEIMFFLPLLILVALVRYFLSCSPS